MDLSYILNELGETREHYFQSVSPPLMQSSNFAFKQVDELRQALSDEYSHFLYSRGMNPTVEILRKKLAALDGAEDCLVFNSGAAAIFAAVMANVKQGDHLISVQKPYTWAQKLFDNILPKFGIQVSYIDGTQIENFEQAILPNTVLFYLESPNSWTYELQNLQQVTRLARAKNILTIIDNSYCTPLSQQPIQYGIDICLQSATKYIGGHSDVVAGVLTGSRSMMHKIFSLEYLSIGSGITPFHAWLLLRGLRTLPVRLKQISETTHIVVDYLKKHPRVEQVYFPFDKNFPQYDLAVSQMKDAFGLVTFVLKTD